MLIELTDSLLEYKTDEENLLLICLTNLLVSYYEGNHILMATPGICDIFAPKLTDIRAREALNYISKNFYQSYDVLWTIKVVLNNADETKHEMNYSCFEKLMSVQPTYFLSENLDDVRFYKLLAGYYHLDAEMESINVTGGGDTTCRMFAYLCSPPCFLLAIVDSDIKYPECSIGRTAEKCISKHKISAKSYLNILPCHEVENLIPQSYLKKVALKPARNFLQKLQDNDCLDVLQFYDIKNGVVKEKLLESNDYKVYIEELYNTLYGKRKKINPFQKIYEKAGHKDIILPAIHHKALEKFLQEKPDYHSDALENDRKYISDIVYTCLCARGGGPMC